MYTGKCVNCNCSTNLICQLSSQVMAILATHNHDNISFISPHMLKLSVARAVLVMEPEGGVSPVIIIICFTSTLSLSPVCVLGVWPLAVLNYSKYVPLELPPLMFAIEDFHECHKTSKSQPTPTTICLFFLCFPMRLTLVFCSSVP